MYYDVEQGSDEWFKLRCGKITASQFRLCFTNQETKTFKSFIADKKSEIRTGKVKADGYYGEWMQRGNLLEPVARQEYELTTFNAVDNGGFWTLGDYIGDSPDGLIGTDGLIEIKCPKETTMDKYIKNGLLPNEYKWQVYGHLLVTERKWCDFVAYHPSYELFIIHVERDEQIIKELLNKLLLTINLITK